MKIISEGVVYLLFLLVSSHTSAQSANKQTEIKGCLINNSNSKIYIKGQGISDSVITDKKGNFYYRKAVSKKPTIITIFINDEIQLPLYIAPGYKLAINADAIDRASFFNSIKLSGIGSKVNQYNIQNYLLYQDQLIPGSNEWYNISLDRFSKEGLNTPDLDSFAIDIGKTIFNPINSEPHKNFFYEYSLVDIRFRKFFYLFQYAGWNSLSLEQINSLIAENISPEVFKQLSVDNNLTNYFYSETVSYLYLNHLVNQDIATNKEILQSREKRKLEIADSIYTGKIKDYVLARIIRSGIGETFSSAELDIFHSYIKKIKTKETAIGLLSLYQSRKREINMVNYGKEAPNFTLPDTSGNMHSLTDFKGKVVYIDFWASWCRPCKEEMPALKEIYEEYHKKGQLEIISIAVHDIEGQKKRHSFINKQQLNWTQLEDQDDFVWRKYKITSIPRFILIDQQGKIISFDAPAPSEKNKLTLLLDKVIAK